MRNSARLLSTIALLSYAVFVAFPQSAFAYYGYSTPTSPCSLVVDKLVADPAIVKSMEYIDNISSTGVKYKANHAILVKMKVKNTSNQIAPNVTIIDEVPPLMTYVAGPVVFNKGGTSFTITVGDLNPQEEKSFIITFKAAGEDKLPNQAVTCFMNKITAQADNCSGSEDNAQVCIERQVLGATKGGQNPVFENVKQTPSTGPEFGLALVAIQVMLGGAGYLIKKRSDI